MSNEIKYVKKIEISKLWDKFDIEWNLHPDVNILAGGNGSGKSTILDCIYGLLKTGTIIPERRGIIQKLKLVFDNDKCIPYEYLKIKDTIQNLERKAKTDKRFKEIISGIKQEQGHNYKNIKSVEFETHSTSFDELKMNVVELNKILVIDAISTFDRELKLADAVKKLPDDIVKTELDWDIYLLQKEYLDYQLNISKKKDSILEMVDNTKEEMEKLKYSQNRFLTIIDDLFNETGKKVNREANEISFLLDKKPISPYQLSSGEKQLLIILLTVLIQDNKQAILFMDEPEISLHIDWQQKLIGYIRELNPNIQLIIATHSPAIIMEGWLDKVFEINDIIKPKK